MLCHPHHHRRWASPWESMWEATGEREERTDVRRADPNLRVSQAERDAVVDQLSRHAGDGRLDLDEFEARVGEALDAKTRGELDAVLRELPPLDLAPARRPRRRPTFAVPPLAVVVAVIVALAFVVHPAMLFLLWPALCWGGGLWGHRSRHQRTIRV